MIKILKHECDLQSYRTNGNMICKICNLEYWKHPYCGNSKLPENMGNGYFLYVLCNGEHIKL